MPPATCPRASYIVGGATVSRHKYKWWSYAKWMIRLYPARMKEVQRLQEARITAAYSLAPASGSDVARPTEMQGIITLGDTADREMEAVRLAIEHTERLRSGPARLKAIDLIFWKHTHNIQGAAMALYLAEDTVYKYIHDFVLDVGDNFGLTGYIDTKMK